ncbi:hypothetical protein [Sporosarcina sp. FSL K6-3457]|uniref:hypothetical protein n=1 Tax=Sporosarcina sp. FSL K6-3457 TaxID=2978204 RepID=UPI0030F54D34
MKRYWKVISICLITILVIGTFYIQSSLATSNHGKIEFEKVSGDEDELQNIMLIGNFLPDDSNLYQRLQITNEETIDSTNLSFFQRLSKAGTPDLLEDLVEKHKHFMRSKELIPNYFFEDEQIVAYVNIKNSNKQQMKELTFDIEVLTKQSEEVTAFQVDVPQKENNYSMNVVDIQVINNDLKIITRGGNREELRVYTIDRNTQKLVSDEMITAVPVVENSWSDLSIIDDTFYSIGKQKYLLIKIEVFDRNSPYRDDGKRHAVVDELILYDTENNQAKKIDKPSEMVESMDSSSAIYDSTIFIPSQTANSVEVHQYDIENDKWGEILSFDLSDTKDNERGFHTQIVNGKLYTIRDTDHGHTIVISDLQTGKSLYQGKLKVTNQGEVQKNYRLYIYGIEDVQ